MKIVQLTLEEDGYINYLRLIILDKELGILGERIEKDKKIRISLLGQRIRNLIDQEELEGLCLFRFYENITIKNFEADEIIIGDRLKIGETIQEVTSIGRRCLAECKLIQAGEKCDLFSNVVFTRVLKGGLVRVDDEVRLLEQA